MPTLAELSSGADRSEPVEPRVADPLPSEEAEVYAALELGLRDYVEKNGFDHIVLALSGGIDSALVALIAADALGPDRVTVVVMPSPNSTDETQEDARRIAANLGRRADRDLDRRGDGGLRRTPWRRPSRAPSRDSPRRTSRRGSGATW